MVEPLNASIAEQRESIEYMSKWFVGSSSSSKFASVPMIFPSITRLRSPPESTEIFFSAKSPENIIVPQMLLVSAIPIFKLTEAISSMMVALVLSRSMLVCPK